LNQRKGESSQPKQTKSTSQDKKTTTKWSLLLSYLFPNPFDLSSTSMPISSIAAELQK
jgi:hypothetical protein